MHSIIIYYAYIWSIAFIYGLDLSELKFERSMSIVGL